MENPSDSAIPTTQLDFPQPSNSSEISPLKKKKSIWKKICNGIFRHNSDLDALNVMKTKNKVRRKEMYKRINHFMEYNEFFNFEKNQLKIEGDDNYDIAMAIRIPADLYQQNTDIIIELERTKQGTNVYPSNEHVQHPIFFNCVEQKYNRSVFTGNIKVPPAVNLTKLTSMPLFLFDSTQEIPTSLNTDFKFLSRIKPIRQSMSNDVNGTTMVGELKLKVIFQKKMNAAQRDRKNDEKSPPSVNISDKVLECSFIMNTAEKSKSKTLVKGPHNSEQRTETTTENEQQKLELLHSNSATSEASNDEAVQDFKSRNYEIFNEEFSTKCNMKSPLYGDCNAFYDDKTINNANVKSDETIWPKSISPSESAISITSIFSESVTSIQDQVPSNSPKNFNLLEGVCNPQKVSSFITPVERCNDPTLHLLESARVKLMDYLGIETKYDLEDNKLMSTNEGTPKTCSQPLATDLNANGEIPIVNETSASTGAKKNLKNTTDGRNMNFSPKSTYLDNITDPSCLDDKIPTDENCSDLISLHSYTEEISGINTIQNLYTSSLTTLNSSFTQIDSLPPKRNTSYENILKRRYNPSKNESKILTYSLVENDVKNMIKDLLSESQDIKNDVILNGAEDTHDSTLISELEGLACVEHTLKDIIQNAISGERSNDENSQCVQAILNCSVNKNVFSNICSMEEKNTEKIVDNVSQKTNLEESSKDEEDVLKPLAPLLFEDDSKGIFENANFEKIKKSFESSNEGNCKSEQNIFNFFINELQVERDEGFTANHQDNINNINDVEERTQTEKFKYIDDSSSYVKDTLMDIVDRVIINESNELKRNNQECVESILTNLIADISTNEAGVQDIMNNILDHVQSSKKIGDANDSCSTSNLVKTLEENCNLPIGDVSKLRATANAASKDVRTQKSVSFYTTNTFDHPRNPKTNNEAARRKMPATVSVRKLSPARQCIMKNEENLMKVLAKSNGLLTNLYNELCSYEAAAYELETNSCAYLYQNHLVRGCIPMFSSTTTPPKVFRLQSNRTDGKQKCEATENEGTRKKSQKGSNTRIRIATLKKFSEVFDMPNPQRVDPSTAGLKNVIEKFVCHMDFPKEPKKSKENVSQTSSETEIASTSHVQESSSCVPICADSRSNISSMMKSIKSSNVTQRPSKKCFNEANKQNAYLEQTSEEEMEICNSVFSTPLETNKKIEISKSFNTLTFKSSCNSTLISHHSSQEEQLIWEQNVYPNSELPLFSEKPSIYSHVSRYDVYDNFVKDSYRNVCLEMGKKLLSNRTRASTYIDSQSSEDSVSFSNYTKSKKCKRNTPIAEKRFIEIKSVKSMLSSESEGLLELPTVKLNASNPWLDLTPKYAQPNICPGLIQDQINKPSSSHGNPAQEGSQMSSLTVETSSASESEYEGDQDTCTLDFPLLKYTCKSEMEMNTNSEIELIERNVADNRLLEERIQSMNLMASEQDLVFYDSSLESSTSSLTLPPSESKINLNNETKNI